MYVAKNMQMHETQCQRFIREYPFALLMSENPLQGTHLPMVFHPQKEGPCYLNCWISMSHSIGKRVIYTQPIMWLS
jgi:predicted FMN-binding regulatory protein PaiB